MPVLSYTFAGFFLATVFLLQWFIRDSYPWWIYAALALAAIAGLSRPRRAALTAACIGIAVAMTAVSHAAVRGRYPDLDSFIGAKNLTMKGTMIGQPDDRGDRIQLTVLVDRVVTASGTTVPARGRILVTDKRRAVIPLPGDRMEVTGKLIRADAGSPYARYLTMRDMGAAMDAQSIAVTGDTGRQRFTRTLWRFNRFFHDAIGRVLPEPASGLLDGLLTGANGALSMDLAADFRTTGLSHIVAVSGSNITVILSMLGGVFFFLPLKWRFFPCVAGIIVFTLFVGASASVVRAAVTGIIGLLALQTGRMSDARLATLWTAFLMLLWNPWQLWADAGFQLSFLAVIGLIELAPLFEPLLARLPSAGGMREALTTTLCAQCTAVAWGAYSFGALPLISPVANVLVAPLIPLGMLTGFLAVLTGLIMPPLGAVAAFPAFILLQTIISLARLCARIPYASVSANVSAGMLMAWYALLCLAVWRIRKRRNIVPPLPIESRRMVTLS